MGGGQGRSRNVEEAEAAEVVRGVMKRSTRTSAAPAAQHFYVHAHRIERVDDFDDELPCLTFEASFAVFDITCLSRSAPPGG
mmetsp:Transcript_97424/g.142568  ORF Transcript_97424/g.142568 Transcript_97424/m.142568 type:complete len:82 (-) Transcript_97424:12-257(-)